MYKKAGFFSVALICTLFFQIFAQSTHYQGFLFDKFEKGKIIYKTRGQTSEGWFNYDCINEKVLFVIQDTVILELDRTDIVSELIIHDRIFEHIGKGIFYEKVKVGENFLYVRRKTRLIYEENEGGYGTRPTTGAIDRVNQINSMGSLYVFNTKNDYNLISENIYYLKDNKGFNHFSSFDSLAKLFNSCQGRIKTYVKNNQFNFSVLDDIIKVVNYAFETCK